MFLLPPFLREFLRNRQKAQKQRVYLRDELVVVKVKEIAVDQRREEQEVYDDIIKAGMKVLSDKDQYANIWDSLSHREQQVTALTCLGYRSYEMADMLGISYDTVRTHSKHIYGKFGLNRKELRLALQGWNFQEWLETNQI
jgi:DNA-binding CsgD family transcriptional regulator